MNWISGIRIALAALICASTQLQAAEPATVRVGILQFGTVSWELEVMEREGFAKREGIRLEIVPLALKDATNVAIQGEAVDIIVNDWIWVARQRAEGRDFTFVPYSMAVGGVMVRPDSGVHAGGLARQAARRCRRAAGQELVAAQGLRPSHRGRRRRDAREGGFCRATLLNELVLRGELSAALNYWHYGARLKAAGLHEMLSMDEILAGLGVNAELPLVGWVFREGWARQNRGTVSAFLRASAAAKAHMRESDEVWTTLRPLMRVEDDATFIALRDGFRAGIPAATMGEAEQTARQVFDILATEGARRWWATRRRSRRAHSGARARIGEGRAGRSVHDGAVAWPASRHALRMRRIRQTGDATLRLVSLLVFVLLWQVAAIVLDSSTLPAPLTVFGRVVDETVSLALPSHLAITLSRVVIGFRRRC